MISPSSSSRVHTAAARQTAPSENAPAQNEQPQDIQVIELQGEDAMELMAALFGGGLPIMDPETAAVVAAIEAEFDRMKEGGYEAFESAPVKVMRSQGAGFESLVQFKKPEGRVVPFQGPQDIIDFAALVSGGSDAPTHLKESAEKFKSLEDQGDTFYFARGGGRLVEFLPLKKGKAWLQTDAAGAALMLSHGESVHRLLPDGTVTVIKNARDLGRAAEAERAAPGPRDEAGKLIENVKSLGLEVIPDFELPEDMSVTDLKRMASQYVKGYLLSHVRDDPQFNSLLQQGYMTEKLASGGHVQVAFPGQMRPTMLGAEQLQTLVAWEKAPTAEMKAFQENFEALAKDGFVMMARASAGLDTGQLMEADARRAYLNVAHGAEVVALDKEGGLHSVTSAGQVEELKKTGKVAVPDAARTDKTTPKKNLFMLYFVSPFNPVGGEGIYEDLPLRIAGVGSSDQADMVTLRSDLPTKKNLRRDYIHKGELEMLERLDVNQSMADPEVFENFVYQSIKEHPANERIRLMVAGHGGAEKGLLPDGKDNDAAAHNAMSVDNFAGAIKKACDRIEKETGTRPVIDNLIVGSCLMGNTSFINALASTGDVKALSASPEVLMGNDPKGIFEYINDPATAGVDGLQFAKDMVGVVGDAAAFPGGKKNLQFADTFGAYDLDPAKNQAFKTALNGFFQACTDKPEYAQFIKEDIAACPTYGVNRVFNAMMNVDDRDLIQVAERIKGDARIKDEGIKEACRELIEAHEAQVVTQKVSERYDGRKGATIYLPVDRYDFDEKMASTDLLSAPEYKAFMDLVLDAPIRRNVVDNVFAEVDRVTAAMKKASEEMGGGSPFGPPDSDVEEGGGQPAPQSEEMKKWREEAEAAQAEFKAYMKERQAEQAAGQVRELEEPRLTPLHSAGVALRQAIKTGAWAVGAAVGGAAGAVIGAPVGLVLGGLAGFRGKSIVGSSQPEEEKEIDPMAMMMMGVGDVKSMVKLATQAALTPSEIAGQTIHHKAAYKAGQTAGRLAGAAVGAPAGVVGGAAAGAAVGGLVGGALTKGLAHVLTFWLPGEPSKPEPQGMMLPFM